MNTNETRMEHLTFERYLALRDMFSLRLMQKPGLIPELARATGVSQQTWRQMMTRDPQLVAPKVILGGLPILAPAYKVWLQGPAIDSDLVTELVQRERAARRTGNDRSEGDCLRTANDSDRAAIAVMLGP
jgi:hypothetical protein